MSLPLTFSADKPLYSKKSVLSLISTQSRQDPALFIPNSLWKWQEALRRQRRGEGNDRNRPHASPDMKTKRVLKFEFYSFVPLEGICNAQSWWCSRWVVSDSCDPMDCTRQVPLSWDFPGNTRVGSPFLFQEIFLTEGLNSSLLSLLHCRWILNSWTIREACNTQPSGTYYFGFTAIWL